MRDDHGEDDVFDEQLRERFNALRAVRGACPSPLTVIRFAEGDLAVDEAKQVADHVAACGPCDAAVFRLAKARRRSVWHPLIAYTTAACLAVALAVTLWPLRRTEPGNSVLGKGVISSVQVLSLDATRQAALEAGESSVAQFLALTFFVPVERNARYAATVRDGVGNVIISQPNLRSYDGLGNFLLVFPRQALKRGQYQLGVEDSAGTRYHFEFKL